MRKHIVYCFLSVRWSLSQRNQQSFGSRCLVDRLSQWDEIWQIDRGGLAVHQCRDWWTLILGDPWHQNIEVYKIFCDTFLVHRLAERGEIWHSEGRWCVADLNGFLWTSVHFSRGGYLSHLGWQNLAPLGIWPIATYFQNFLNFGPGVTRYHAATCISPCFFVVIYGRRME